MIRIAAACCFALTLLCPVFCLAGGDVACSDHGRDADRNCEAMTTGAVVTEQVPTVPPPPVVPVPFSLPFLAGPRPTAAGVRRRAATVCSSATSPPPAATRQALLQVFLF